MKYITSLVFCCLTVLSLLSCRKYLDKQPDASLQVPGSVADYRAILDQDVNTAQCTPGLGPMGTTDYWVDPSVQSGLSALSLGASTWQPDLYQGNTLSSWSNPYTAIYNCNVVLDGLPQLTGLDNADKTEYNAVYGGALFIRALQLFYLEETFGQPWRPGTAAVDAGIPLRLSADPLKTTPRSSVQAVFGQIAADLSHAAGLLPVAVQVSNRNRPCRSAAYGLLARIWLTQQDYLQAKRYADSSLLLYDSLVDYNTIDSTTAHPFPTAGNAEVLFQCSAFNYPLQYAKTTMVDTTLFNSYAPDDLRKVVFFQRASSGSGMNFKGDYTGLFYLFSGIAVDDIYLIRAECKVRSGDIAGAMSDLDTLLARRWRKGTFRPLTVLDPVEALQLVLTERRKETLFREGRWSDLRRLNQNPATADTLSRVMQGVPYTLKPGDVHYTWLIPMQEITLGGITQNPG